MFSFTKLSLRLSIRSWLSSEQVVQQQPKQLLKCLTNLTSHRFDQPYKHEPRNKNLHNIIINMHSDCRLNHSSVFIQLSCASASPILSDRKRFKKYFQLLPSMDVIAYGYLSVFRQYVWKKVALIVQRETLFTEVVCVALDLNHSTLSLQLMKLLVYTSTVFFCSGDEQTEESTDERRNCILRIHIFFTDWIIGSFS